MNLNIQLKELYASQLAVWEMARQNVDNLQNAELRSFTFGDVTVMAQFNPARIVSSGANVDTKSIQERQCFLCAANRPVFQEAVIYKGEYEILINPFPILPLHFTIPRIEHVQQQILPYIGDMLNLANELNEFTILYNGPASGASAPDHMHFQAVKKNLLPVEKEYESLMNNAQSLFTSGVGKCYVLPHYLRTCVVIESADKDACIDLFTKIYNKLSKRQSNHYEPMMNIVCSFRNGKWLCFVFPRQQHRPSQYYAEGDAQLIISPGAIDMAGILITPRYEDFQKLDETIIKNIYQQVSDNGMID